MQPVNNPRQRFCDLFAGDKPIDLIEAALMIALEHDPALDPARCRTQLKALANDARESVDLDSDAQSIARQLCDFLYRQEGFTGNHRDYYDPANSYFDQVLTRRTGIPISLALVYIGVGELLDLHIEPVGFPGHFLVKLVDGEGVYLDPYSGQVVSHDDCRELLKTCTQGRVPFKPELLATTGERDVVRRMLGNLKAIYTHRGDFAEVLSICDRMLLVGDNMPPDLLDRARVLEHLECYDLAARDLEQVLENQPPPQVDAAIRKKIAELRDRSNTPIH